MNSAESAVSRTLSHDEIAALLRKYREMARMRRAHETGEELDAKGDMQKLAREFPGALREIDRLSSDEMTSRIARLEELREGPPGAEAPAWALYANLYHSLTRDALAAKRSGSISEILSPTSGRINPAIFAEIASRFCVTSVEVEAEIFGRGAMRSNAAP